MDTASLPIFAILGNSGKIQRIIFKLIGHACRDSMEQKQWPVLGSWFCFRETPVSYQSISLENLASKAGPYGQ